MPPVLEIKDEDERDFKNPSSICEYPFYARPI
jgi:hypothetical protein